MIPLLPQVFLRKVSQERVSFVRCWLLICSHSNQIGDVQKDKLPGPEALLEPGKKDGQVSLI